MSQDHKFLEWVERQVTFDPSLSQADSALKEWHKHFSAIASSMATTTLPEGELFIGEELATFSGDDFSFWLKRAFKREHAQAAHYDRALDELVERKVSWNLKSVEELNKHEKALLPMGPQGKHAALFLDRDGIINVDGGYINKVEDVVFVPDIDKVIGFANKRGIKVIVLTNQSGVGRGLYSEKDVIILHQWMQEELQKKGAIVDAWYYSPYHPEATQARYKRASYTRKPMPGMALSAAYDHHISLEKSAMIGDKVSDVLAHVDIKTFLLKGNYPLGNYDKVFADHEIILDELARFYR